MNTSMEQIMSSEVVKVDAKASLNEVKKVFQNKRIRHLPVVSENKLVGIISRTDIMRLSFGDNYNDNFGFQEKTVDYTLFDAMIAEDAMTRNPVTIKPDDSLIETAEFILQQSFHALPVVKDGELLGIVTTTDIIRHLLNYAKAN